MKILFHWRIVTHSPFLSLIISSSIVFPKILTIYFHLLLKIDISSLQSLLGDFNFYMKNMDFEII